MLYDEYSKKIKRIAESKNFILRFRIIIIVVAALIVSLTVALLAAKGSVTGGITISDAITYGEDYEYSAKAAMSDILAYEFKNVNEDEWTEEVPLYVGEYQIRVKVNKAFGVGYSKPKNFKIVPKALDIDINVDEITYGNYPTYNANGLNSTDRINSLSFTFEDLTQEKTMVNPVLDSIEIIDNNNVDVTNCYTITGNGKELKFIKRSISLTPETISRVYDGGGVAPTNSYTITSPNATGYSDVIEIRTIIKDANGNVVEKAILPGVYTSTIEVVKILNNGNDVTGNYQINKIENTIKITKRPITVATSSASKIYDGTSLSSNDFNLSTNTQYSLLQGHSLGLEVAGPSVTEYTSQAVKNNLAVGVFDSDGNNIDALYDITYEYGTLSILKRDITIKTGSTTREYDGTSLSNSAYALAEGFTLAGGDNLTLDLSNSSIINVGTIDNILSVKVNNGVNDVSNSYNINYEYGTLTVNPRNITIKPLDIPDFTYNGYEGTYPNSSNNFNLISGSLVSGEDINITVNITPNTGSSLTDAGDYTVSYKDYRVVNGSKSNYNITVDGTTEFTINKREITVSPISYSAVYLEDYSYDTSKYTTTGLGLVGNDKLSVEVSYDSTPLNVGSYAMTISNYSFVSGNANNYIVSYSLDTEYLEITKRPITIAVKPQASKVYSNEVYEYPETEFIITKDNNQSVELFALHNSSDWIKLDVATYDASYISTSIINAGNYFLKANSYEVSPNVLENYEISLSNSYVPFEITKRPITVKAIDHEITYNNTSYIYPANDYVIIKDNNKDVITSTLIDGTTLSVNVRYAYNDEIVNNPYQAGIYDVFTCGCNLTISQENNYIVSYADEAAKLTINKQNIEITTRLDSLSKIYDGLAYSYNTDNYRITKIGDNIVDQVSLNDASSISFTSVNYYNNGSLVNEICDAGKYTFKATALDGNEYFNRNYNYQIVDNIEEFTIEKRTVEVAAANLDTLVYNNTNFIYPENYMKLTYTNGLVSSSVVSIDSIKLSVEFLDYSSNVVTPNAVGNYLIRAVGVEVDEAYAKNYDVTYSNSFASFAIVKREIVISPIAIDSVVYDGTKAEYPKTQFTVSGGLGEDCNEIPTASIEVSVTYRTDLGYEIDPINAGTYYTYITGVTGQYDNYIISYSNEPVPFTIQKREITIQATTISDITYGDSYVYDNSKYVVVKDNNVDVNETYLRCGGNLTVNVQYKDNEGNVVNPVNAGKYYVYITDFECDNAHNYIISKSDTPTEFNILPRDVEIKAVSDEIVYSNEKYVYNGNNYLVYDKKSGEILESFRGSLSIKVSYEKDDVACDPINAGTYSIVITSLVYNEQTALNYNLEISSSFGQLVILPRKITLSVVELESVVYSASEYVYNSNLFKYEYDSNQGIPATDIIASDASVNITVGVEFRQAGAIKTPINAGTYEIYVVSHTASSNYEVSYSSVPGYFEITPKIVRIKPACDGETQVFTNLEMEYTKNKYVYVNEKDVFLGDDDIEVTTSTVSPPINAGAHIVYLSLGEMIHGIKDNYSIMLSEGIITITPRSVSISPKDQVSTYNGSIYEYPIDQFNIEIDTATEVIYNSIYDNITNNLSIVVGFTTLDGETVSPKNAGKYLIYVKAHNTNSTSMANYVISYSSEPANLEIVKRNVSVAATDQPNYTFSGEPYSYPNSSFEIYDNGSSQTSTQLVDGSEITVEVIYKNALGEIVEPINAGTYYIYINNVIFSDSNKKQNYHVDYSTIAKTLTITQREVYIKLANISDKTYDGTVYSYPSNSFVVYKDNGSAVNKTELVNKESLVLNVNYTLRDSLLPATPKNAGTYNAYISSIIADELTLSNYVINFSTEPEEFTIKKLSILVMPNLLKNDYGRFDGTAKALSYDIDNAWKYVDSSITTNNHLAYVDNRLLNGDSLTYDLTINPNALFNAGTYKVSLANMVFTPGEEDGTVDNYQIIRYTDVATIAKADITLEAVSSPDIVYRDKYYSYSGEYKVVSLNGDAVERTTLLNGETISLKVKYFDSYGVEYQNVKDVGNYKLQASSILTSDLSVENNYNITFSDRQFVFEITKRQIMVSPVGVDKTYTGEEYLYSESNYKTIEPDRNHDGYNDLISSHTLTIKVYFINTETGECFGYGYESNPVDIGKYLIRIAEINIVDYSGASVIANYEILEPTVNEYLEISKYHVTIKAISQTKDAYDGIGFIYPTASTSNPYYGDENYKTITGVEVVSGKFVKDDSISISVMYVNVVTGEAVLDEFGRYAPAVNAGKYYIRIYAHSIINAPYDNYDVTYENTDDVILTIGKRTIYYKPRVASNLTYNFAVQEINPYPYYAGTSEEKALHSLVGSDTFTFNYTVTDKNMVEELTIRNANTYYINVISSSVVFTEGLASNYDIIFTQGSFRVNPLPITVAYKGNVKSYDATAIIVSDEDFVITVDSTGDALPLDYNITSLSIKYNGSSIQIAKTVNAGKYEIKASDIYFTDSSQSASNFSITYVANNYIVNKLALDVTLKDYEFTYDGEAIDYDFVNTRILSGTVINDQIIKVHVKFSSLDFINQEVYLSNEALPVHAGRYLIEYLSYEQYDQFGTLEDDLGLNYIINCEASSSLVINKATVYISTNDVDYIYDGNPYVYDTSNYTKDAGLNVASDGFRFNVYYVDSLGYEVLNDIGQRISPTAAGMYDIRIDLTSVKQTINGKTTLYDDYLVYEDEGSIGKLNIYKANINIEITNTDYVSIYGNNLDISYIVYDDDLLDLPEGYSVKPVFTYLDSSSNYLDNPVNVGVYKAEIVDFIIKYNGIELDKNNYQITPINADFIRYEIIKRDLYVYGNNYSYTYNGEAFNESLSDYNVNNILSKDSEYLSVAYDYYLDGVLYSEDIINADEYTIKIINAEFTDPVIAGNYNINITDGLITINPIIIQFVVELSGSRPYDGKTYAVGDAWSYYENTQMPLGDTVVTPVFSYVANENTYDVMQDAYKYNIVLSDIIVENGLYQNYTGLIVGKPTYEITKLPVTIKTGSLETYYTGEDVVFTEEFTVSEESLNTLVAGHLIQWDEAKPTTVAANKITTSTGVDNKLGAVIYYIDSYGVKHFVTHNYLISYEYGKIIVNPRPITLISGTRFAEYQGSTSKYVLSCTDFTIGDNIYSNEYYGLLPSHTITVTKSTQVTEYTGEPVDNVQTYKIASDTLGAVTSCYDIEYVYGELMLTKASISIGIDDVLEEDNLLYTGDAYDILNYITISKDIVSTGDKIDPTSITYRMIKNQLGEDIEPVEYASLINAGTYEINISNIRIVKKSNASVDLTNCYDITYINEASTFVIIPLVVKITTGSYSCIWDGNDLFDTYHLITNKDSDLNPDSNDRDGKITEGLIAGHHTRVISYATLAAYDALGNKRLSASCDNVMEFEIYDENGIVQNHNYIIECTFGELSFISDFAISSSHTKVFDYETVTLEELNTITSTPVESNVSKLSITYVINGIYSDYELTTPAEIYDVGTYYLDVDFNSICYYVNGVLLTEEEVKQFNISYGSFRYFVHTRAIAIRPKALSVEYDGNIHGCTPDEFEDGINYEILTSISLKEGHSSLSTLLEGDYAVIETSISPKTSPMSTRGYITEMPTIYDKDGNDVTYRYYIYYSPNQFTLYTSDKKQFYSKFEIIKRKLQYETSSAEKVYDGTELYCDDFVSFDDSRLLSGHHIEVTSGGLTTINAGKKANKIKFYVYDESGNDVTRYYDKTSLATYGYLTVTKREITVTTGSDEKVYDGKPLTCNTFTYYGTLVEGHVIDVTIKGTITYKGTVSNSCSSPRVVSSDGSTVYTSNYSIKVVYGTLTIKGTYE